MTATTSSRGGRRRTSSPLRPAVALFLAGLVGCGVDPQPDRGGPDTSSSTMDLSLSDADLSLDHLILGIGDLEVGIREFGRRTGVRPVFGGTHPGRGTQNALVALEDGAYLEILAPVRPAGEEPEGWLADLAALDDFTPVGWAVGTRDIDELRERLQAGGVETTEIAPGSRVREDGSRLEWRTLGIVRPTNELMPFFIEWSDPELQPSRTSPGGCRLESLAFEHPDHEAVAEQFAAVGVDATAWKAAAKDAAQRDADARVEAEVRSGPRPRMAFELSCPKGRVGFPREGDS